jgi:tetratricopeptide (TPR) repeat protein
MKYFTFISILVLLFSQPTMLWAGSYQNFIDNGHSFNDAGNTKKAYEEYLQAYIRASTKRQKKTSLASLAVTSLKLGKRTESERYLIELLSLFPNNKWAMGFAKKYQLLSDVPLFRDYPVTQGYIGKPAPVILNSKDKKMFRTTLRKAAKEPANFAGHYVLTTWGCGTSCINGAVVNLRTGEVVFLPGSICCWRGEGERLIFRLNSRLLVTAGIMNEKSDHGSHFFEFTGTKFKHLKTIPVEPVFPNW